jgi:hypothetical protein
MMLVNDKYVDALSHISMMTDYLYFILLNNHEEYNTKWKKEVVQNTFQKPRMDFSHRCHGFSGRN